MRTEPRVLLDATAIPAERGGVGRYVDNLTEALDAAGAALSVVCQNRDAEVVRPARPAQPDHPDRRGTGQPAGPARLGADHAVPAGQAAAGRRHPFAALHDAAGRVGPGRGDPARRHLLLRPRTASRGEGPVLPRLDPDVAASGGGLHRAEPGDRHRTGPLRARRLRLDGGRLSRRRPGGVPRARPGADPLPSQTSSSLGDRPWIAFLGTLEPRKNVPALVRAYIRAMTTADRPAGAGAGRLVRAGTPGWNRRWPRCRTG